MNGKEWRPEHTTTLEQMVRIGCDNAMIAAHTGHCIKTVQRRRSDLGLPDYYAVRYGTWREMPCKMSA